MKKRETKNNEKKNNIKKKEIHSNGKYKRKYTIMSKNKIDNNECKRKVENNAKKKGNRQ